MRSMRSKSRLRRCCSLLLLAFFSAAGIAGCGGGGGARPTSTPTFTPTPIPSVAPPTAGAGLASQIEAVEVSSDPAGQIAVTFTLTDAAGAPVQPVTRAVQSDQEGRVRFTIAHVETYSGGGEFNSELSRYVNDIDAVRPRYDSMGGLETLHAGAGLYRYVFAAHLPEGSDLSRTYTVGLQVDRTVGGEQLSANPVHDFVPAGGTPQIRAGSATAQCNTCHDPLIAHGNRREFRLCTLCHTQAATDEHGGRIGFEVMIHKIHRGVDLPSIVGGPPGASYAIYSSFARSDVVFARKDEEGKISGVAFPRPIQDCTTCHAGGETSHYYTDRPTAAACAACHDDVNPSLVATAAGPPGANHFQSRGFADGDCRFCHVAQAQQEFDVSVPGAHVVPERSQQLAGLNVEIVGLADHGAAAMPVVSFEVTDNTGASLRDLSGLNRLGFTLAGPTTDYTTVLTATAVGGGAGGMLNGPDEAGVFAYTLPAPLPADATGTWALGAEARRSVELTKPDSTDTVAVNEAAVNPVVTFSVDDSSALVRRVVVEDAKCQACHGEFSRGFSIHGNLRNQVEYCVLCHNPNASDVSRRSRDMAAVAAGDSTASIDFKVMIHKIHTGEELAHKPYTIYGFGPAPAGFTVHDFAEVLYPGDRRHCATCHAEDTQLLPPFPGTAIGAQIGHLDPATGREVVDGRLGPITSACTSCHDSDATAAHAETQTASNGDEACAVCHGEGRDVAVSARHDRGSLDR